MSLPMKGLPMIRALPLLAAVSLAGCSQTATDKTVGTVNSVITTGQLFCGIAGTYGPIVAAIINAADSKAVTVTGQASTWVANVCAIVGGIPVVPPVQPAQAPTIAVKLPA